MPRSGTQSVLLLGAVLVFGCDQHAPDPGTGGVHYTVYIPMRDLETNWRGEIAVETSMEPWFAWEEFVEGELASWDGNLRLVRWPSEEVVPGSWVFSVDATTNRGVFAFEPETPLSPDQGWYALQIRFEEIGVRRGYFGPQLFDDRFPGGIGHQYHDGWSTTRFFQASYPLLRVSGGAYLADGVVPASSGALVTMAEPGVVTADVDLTSSIRVEIAEARVRCSFDPATLRTGETFSGIRITCDGPTSAGSFVVDLDTLPLVSSEGLAIHYCGIGGTPRWEGSVGARNLPEGACDDAALLDIPPRDGR